MASAAIVFAVLSAILVVLSHPSSSQTLTLELCSAQLPTPRYGVTALYDGDDTIYLFGGSSHDFYYNDTLKYSISQDSIEPAGQLPISGCCGGAVMNKFENIFYLSSRPNQEKNIYQYFPDRQRFSKVSSFTNIMEEYVTLKADADTALLINGRTDRSNRDIISLNLNTLEQEVLTYMPLTVTYPEGLWVEEKNVAYIFEYANTSNILRFNRSSNLIHYLGFSLPIADFPRAVSAGKFGYLFGNFGENWENSTDQTIMQFDPDTESIRPIRFHVPEFDEPINMASWHSSAAVYVEKLNRIYIFGGRKLGNPSELFRSILYVSLDPIDEPKPTTTTTTSSSSPIPTLDPDIFNCQTRPDGIHIYPGDCAKFVICREDRGYPFECPESLLFHPVNGQCTFPDWVDCDSSMS